MIQWWWRWDDGDGEIFVCCVCVCMCIESNAQNLILCVCELNQMFVCALCVCTLNQMFKIWAACFLMNKTVGFALVAIFALSFRWFFLLLFSRKKVFVSLTQSFLSSFSQFLIYPPRDGNGDGREWEFYIAG